ncbi:MAG TPA: pyridoxal phosphate-dependent aminotransferase, partial [Polyangia bacterium]|nr:pyridoxal phosphate-dependent aminotransferase [Polyangia bacterium]
MKLARRLSVIEPSPTLAVSAKAKALKAKGIDVISFGAGEPDFDTPVHIKDAAKKALDAGDTKYTLVEGTIPLRKGVAAWLGKAHGLTFDVSEIIVSSGAKQSLFNAIHTLVDEGDEVIIPTPAWVSYNDIVKLAGGRPINVPTSAEENFNVRLEDVARAITPRTRIILVCSPSNPTGAVYDEATLRGLAKLAVERDVWLMTDDIYRTLLYGDARFFQPATISPEVRAHTIIIDGVSKAYSMTGWRVGFTAAPKAVIEGMATLQGQSTTHAASMAQAAALAAVEGPTDELEKMRVEFDKRRKVMVKGLREIAGVKCVEPKGAFYAFPDLSVFIGKKTPEGKTIDNDGALCEYLIEAARVAVVPGSAFGAPGYVRLSYATSMKNVEEGVRRMAEALPKLT